MPTIIHCHTARRLQASLAGLASSSLRIVVAATVTALTLVACSGNGDQEIETTAVTKLPESAQALYAEKAAPSYFPSQFPAPDGEIEPLPEQF